MRQLKNFGKMMNLLMIEAKYPQFVSEMSHETKQMFQKFRELMSPVTIDQTQMPLKRKGLRHIAKSCNQKLNSKSKIDRNSFIMELFILLYIYKFGGCYCHKVKFSSEFSSNLLQVLTQLDEWNQIIEQESTTHKCQYLYLLFHSLEVIISIYQRNQDLCEMTFDPQVMEKILKMEIPPSRDLQWPLWMILIKISERRQYLHQPWLLYLSAFSHLEKQYKTIYVKVVSLHILTNCMKKADEIIIYKHVSLEKTVFFLKNLFLQYRPEIRRNNILKLIIKFLKNKDEEVIDSFLSVDELLDLIVKKKIQELDEGSIVNFLKILNKKKISYFLQKLIKMEETSLTLKILEQILISIDAEELLYLISQNLIEKIKLFTKVDEERSLALCYSCYLHIISKSQSYCEKIKSIIMDCLKQNSQFLRQSRTQLYHTKLMSKYDSFQSKQSYLN